LIPLFIAILGDILDKKRNKMLDYAELDLHVILDYVFQFRELLFLVGLMFSPSFFWKYSEARIFIFFVWVISIVGVIKVILNGYKWTKGNVFDFRFPYLKKLKIPKDLESVWSSIWRVPYSEGRMDEKSESKFFDIFSNVINHLLRKRRNGTVWKLLDDFYSNIDNRSISLLVREDINCLEILQWYFRIWQKKDRSIAGKQIKSKLEAIIEKIEERALRENESDPLFDNLKEHISAYGKEKIIRDGREKYYIEDLFRIFYSVFFRVMKDIEDFSKRDVIWEAFPDEWKITKDKYQKYLESKISWEHFIGWASSRIRHSEKDYDELLDDIIENLFPEVDPIIWARILLFIYSPYGPEAKIKYIIERKWHFGDTGRMYSGTGRSGEDIEKWLNERIKKDEEAAYELALFLFKSRFTKENLEKYIDELKKLESIYDKSSREEKHRLRLLNIFTEMLTY